MPTTDMVVFDDARGNTVQLSKTLVRQHLCPNATDEELYQFLILCQHQRLNPWLREAYLIKYDRSKPATMVVGKDVFLQRAEKHPQFDGYEVEVYDQEDQPYRGRSGQQISHATARIFRKDRHHPTVVTVLFKEYDTGFSNWKKMPVTMIRKTVLEQGLRETFTHDFVGLYGMAEMGIDPETQPEAAIDITGYTTEIPDDPTETDTHAEDEAADHPEPPAEDTRDQRENGDLIDATATLAPPKPARINPVSPFAVVTSLAQIYGGAWTRATVNSNGKKIPVSEHYFGRVMGTAGEMAAFAIENPEVWQRAATAIITAAKTRKR